MSLSRVVTLSKALNDETRVRILAAVGRGELCLCQIIELFGLAPSTLSKHVSLLASAGLLRRRKEGRWHYFRLAGDDASSEIRQALEWAMGSLGRDPRIREDARRLRLVLKKDPKEMAACYRS